MNESERLFQQALAFESAGQSQKADWALEQAIAAEAAGQ